MFYDILKIKHWQLVLLLFALIIPVDLAGYYLSQFVSRWIAIPSDILSLTLIIAYPILIWHRLAQLLAGESLFLETKPHRITLAVSLLMTLYILSSPIEVRPLRVMLEIIMTGSLFYIVAAPGRYLKSIELRRNAGVWEYVADSFLFLIWPLGIFWLQPRLNRIREKRISIEE